MKIYRYKLQPGYQVFSIPKGATFLHVETVDTFPSMYWLVDPESDSYEERAFTVVATGEEFDPWLKKYRGTYIDKTAREITFHLWEYQNGERP